MSHISSNLILAVVLVLIGCMSCRSDECTEMNIDNCRIKNKSKDECRYYKKTVMCLQDLAPSCTDDKLFQKLTDMKNWDIKNAALCPGLPDGVCYNHAVSMCKLNIPYDILFNPSLPAADKKKRCHQFLITSKVKKSCLENIKNNLCHEDYISSKISGIIKTVEAVEKKC